MLSLVSFRLFWLYGNIHSMKIKDKCVNQNKYFLKLQLLRFAIALGPQTPHNQYIWAPFILPAHGQFTMCKEICSPDRFGGYFGHDTGSNSSLPVKGPLSSYYHSPACEHFAFVCQYYYINSLNSLSWGGTLGSI